MRRAWRTVLVLALLGSIASCVRPDTPREAALGDSVVPGTIGMLVRREAAGVVVTALRKDGPAAAAGLRPGDIVVRFNGVSVADTGQIYRLMLDSPPGGTVEIEVLRDGAPHRFDVRIEQIDTALRV